MKTILILSGLLLAGCASFHSGFIDFRQASSTPGAIMQDSIYVHASFMDSHASSTAFDYNFHQAGIQPLTLSLSNRSSINIEFIPSTISDYLRPWQAYDNASFDPTTRLMVWSIPWMINMVANQPWFYGIAWPIMGLVDFFGASSANREMSSFIQRVSFKPVKLEPGKDTQGIIVVTKTFIPIKLYVTKANGQKITFDLGYR